MDSHRLHRRLQRVRNLAERGATHGERTAARAAAARLEARLEQAPGKPFRGASLDSALRPGPAEVVPSTTELRAAIEAWHTGDRTAADLAEAARDLVDRVVLPDRPAHDPLSIRVEVVMLLTSLGEGPIGIEDTFALLAFLDAAEEDPEQAWKAWFRHLEGQPIPAVSAG